MIFDKKNFYYVTAGRMVKQKGQWHLLKAFAKVKEKVDNVKLIVLGDGEYMHDLNELSKTLSIEEDVIFSGFIDNPYTYIAKSSVFVLPSLFEGLGNVIIEAMACETLVISYDCLAGPRELIAPNSEISLVSKDVEWEEFGILVPPADDDVDFSGNISRADEYLAKAMIMAYNDPQKCLSRIAQAKERIKEFEPNRIITEWEKVL